MTPTTTADTVHDLLAHRDRRLALEYIVHERTVEFDELRDFLAAEDGPPDDPMRVAVALVHNHLPRLEDAGVIEYDHGAGTVAVQTIPTALRQYLIRFEDLLSVREPQPAD